MPLGSPPPSRSNQASLSVKADPFAVPDNVYRDSWLDSLWIKLFSSRMSAAVEAEARERCGLLLAGGESAAAGNTSSARRTSAKEEGGGEGEGRTIGATMESSAAAANGNTGRSNGAAAVVVGSLNSGVSVEGGVRVGYTYKDYVDLATRLQAGPPERQRQVVRGVLRSIFPAWFPAFYRTLFPVSKVSFFFHQAFACSTLLQGSIGDTVTIPRKTGCCCCCCCRWKLAGVFLGSSPLPIGGFYGSHLLYLLEGRLYCKMQTQGL